MSDLYRYRVQLAITGTVETEDPATDPQVHAASLLQAIATANGLAVTIDATGARRFYDVGDYVPLDRDGTVQYALVTKTEAGDYRASFADGTWVALPPRLAP